MRTTIKDVARAANVSPSTVSLVLNDKPVPITKETRKKVHQAVRELKYRPNQLAISLVTKTSNTVGLIIPDSINPFFAYLSHYIEIKLRKNGINLIVGNTNGDPEVTRNYIDIFADRRVDGIILAQLDFKEKEETLKCQELLQSIEIPIVYVDRVAENHNHFSVEVDQKLIGYTACKHLIELGHTKIGCASGSMELNVNISRYEGYKQALIEHNISLDEKLLFSDSLSIECGSKALPLLLGQNVTAIFAFNDMIAYGIYKECRHYNLQIPNDISVIGVDDIALSDIVQPPLTTIAQPVEAIADLAINGMIDLIQGDKKIKVTHVLKPILKVRGSTTQI